MIFLNMRRAVSSLPFCRRPVRYIILIASCVAAFISGCMVTLISIDPTHCDVHQCTEKIKRIDIEDTNTWLGSWRKVRSNEKNVFLVIIILTAPNNVEQRNVIRQTWLSEEKMDTMHFFVVGIAGLNEDVNTTIQSEQKRFSDMLFLNNIYDSYEALTKKLLASFVYLHHNVKYRFLLKCDDDTYVQMSQLHQELKSVPYKQRLHWGFFDGRATPKRSGPWKETEWVLCDHYLPYALGGGYVLSSDLVAFIAANSKYVKLYNSEDVSVGAWLAPIDVHRVHDTRFDTEYKSRGCNNEYIISHKQTVLHMREKFNNLKNSGFLCREQFQVRKSYKYNWSVPPSQCCIRNDSTIS